MTPQLRLATPADAQRVADLLVETRARFMPYAPSAHPEHEVRTWVASHLVASGGVTVVEVDGRVMAAMATESRKPFSWITQMAVDPLLVGQGVGSLLLAHALRTLSAPIRLYTFQANAGARRFYERHGFAAIEFTDGQANEERCPDVLYEIRTLIDRRPQELVMPEGSCHCGAVRLTLPSTPEVATVCNCSLCRRIGGRWAYFEFGTVKVEGHPANTAEYIWGDKTLRTIHCKTCACVTHWEPLNPAPGAKHGVNLANFDPSLVAAVRVRRFDGADTWKFIDE